MNNAPRAASRPAGQPRPAAAADRGSRRRRVLMWVLLAGVASLLTNAIVGENGYFTTLRLERTEAALLHRVSETRLENQRLREERIRLESDQDAIEDAIRRQLGYIYPGEVRVVVHDAPVLPEDPAP